MSRREIAKKIMLEDIESWEAQVEELTMGTHGRVDWHAFRNGLKAGVGDEDYRGEVKVLPYNHGDEPEMEVVEELDETLRQK